MNLFLLKVALKKLAGELETTVRVQKQRLQPASAQEKNSAITLRKHKAGQAPEGNDALQLSDLYKLLQSVEKRLSDRLSAIEKTLMERLQLPDSVNYTKTI